MSFILLLIFILGLILGSFFNVVGLRIPLKKSIVFPGSSCSFCSRQLKPAELIPVVSYLFQGGRCRGCKAMISPIYPLIELGTGLLFVSAPLLLGWASELIVAWTLTSLLIIIVVSDIMYMIIPDKILVVFSAFFLIERIFIPLDPWMDSIYGAAGGFALLLFIAVISKGGMGGGDIKLYAVIGFVIGAKLMLLSFFMATLYGALFGLLSLISGKVKRGSAIPFGPFIGAGTLTSYYFGVPIINQYLQWLSEGF